MDYAIKCSKELGKPLVLYEGLRADYPWVSARIHRFVLDGMRDNQKIAKKVGATYWPFVESKSSPARGILKQVAERACLIVTDDFPCFIVPEQSARLAQKVSCAMYAVDGNGLVPLSMLGAPVAAAAHLRPRLQKLIKECERADAEPEWPKGKPPAAPFALWNGEDVEVPSEVAPVAGVIGGTTRARELLQTFVEESLKGYAEERSEPRPPSEGHASGLSPYLHFGHISAQEMVEAVGDIAGTGKGKEFWSKNADVAGFLDQVITWRDVGFQWHWSRREDTASLQRALPAWAQKTLHDHRNDEREHLYTLAEFESAATHDELWNAAQKELVATGTMHNYMRMLWGKKVIEWSSSPEEAYKTLEHLNNKYAYDGRNPNSYTGILWCFGLFDRPWPPERKIFGSVRWMSSANTAKKFDVDSYLAYAAGLQT